MKNYNKKLIISFLVFSLFTGCFSKKNQEVIFEIPKPQKVVNEVNLKESKLDKDLENLFETSKKYLDAFFLSPTGFAPLIVNFHYGQNKFIIRNVRDLSSDIKYFYETDSKLDSLKQIKEFVSDPKKISLKKNAEEFFLRVIENDSTDATMRAYSIYLLEDKHNLSNLLKSSFSAEKEMLDALNKFYSEDQGRKESVRYLFKNYSKYFSKNNISKSFHIYGENLEGINNCFKIIAYKKLLDLKE